MEARKPSSYNNKTLTRQEGILASEQVEDGGNTGAKFMDDDQKSQRRSIGPATDIRTSSISSLDNNNSNNYYADSITKSSTKSIIDHVGLSRERIPVRDNEPLLGGFAILRAAQLLNLDIYYIGLGFKSNEAARLNRIGDLEAASKAQQSGFNEVGDNSGSGSQELLQRAYYRTFLDELAEYNPLQKYIDCSPVLGAFCRFVKICLSLMAIMIGIDKTFSTIVLCLSTRFKRSDDPAADATDNSRMGLFVLILVNLSSMYILFSTVFNGHLLWNLLGQRLFFVSKRFQIKTMLSLLIFIYLEYMINISFINNLYEWNFISNNIQSEGYSVLANLRIVVTEQDEDHYYTDTLLTIVQFARGIIRISPYITINYLLICLKRHIHTIRNQHLLTNSLKKRTKLRLVVSNKRGTTRGRGKGGGGGGSDQANMIKKKKVIFLTDENNFQQQGQNNTTDTKARALNMSRANGGGGYGSITSASAYDRRGSALSPVLNRSISSIEYDNSSRKVSNSMSFGQPLDGQCSPTTSSIIGHNQQSDNKSSTAGSHAGDDYDAGDDRLFLDKIRDFEELESYITNLYIFTGRLNRFMGRQGLTVFFIVHNLVISVSVIMPESVRGGFVMVHLIRFLVIMIGLVPFIIGQSLNGQLGQLSKQIDRIIIQQQFINRKRDNLVRIRELVHDIRIDCGGMNFNVETGIKYLVVAFASAFFIEQEHYKLTRRH